MNRKGSMTIYFSLILAVMVPLICGAIVSAKVSADRALSANSMDLAMFSLFAHYDRDLAGEYGLFFLDAAGSGGSVSPSACLREIEEAMDECLHPERGRLLSGKSILDVSRKQGFIEGYTLATDAGGAPFEAEAIQADENSMTEAIRRICIDNRLTPEQLMPKLDEAAMRVIAQNVVTDKVLNLIRDSAQITVVERKD